MKALDVLYGEASQKNLKLGAKDTNDFTLVGSSVPTNVKPNTGRLQDLFLQVPVNLENGLVVINARFEQRHKYTTKITSVTYHNFFIPIIREGDNFFLDLKNSWMPPAGVLPKVVLSDGYQLEVEIGEECFTTDPEGSKIGKRVVENSNLLCRFLAGEVAIDELRASASEVIRQRTLEEQFAELKLWHEATLEREAGREKYVNQIYLDLAIQGYVHGDKCWQDLLQDFQRGRDHIKKLTSLALVGFRFRRLKALWNWRKIRYALINASVYLDDLAEKRSKATKK